VETRAVRGLGSKESTRPDPTVHVHRSGRWSEPSPRLGDGTSLSSQAGGDGREEGACGGEPFRAGEGMTMSTGPRPEGHRGPAPPRPPAAAAAATDRRHGRTGWDGDRDDQPRGRARGPPPRRRGFRGPHPTVSPCLSAPIATRTLPALPCPAKLAYPFLLEQAWISLWLLLFLLFLFITNI
jgi:hypothetical protein